MASWQPRTPRHPDMDRALNFNEDLNNRRMISDNRRSNQLRTNNILIKPQPKKIENVPIHEHPKFFMTIDNIYRSQLMAYLEAASDREVQELVQFCGFGIPFNNRNPPVPNLSTNNDSPLIGDPGTTHTRDNDDGHIAQPGSSTQSEQIKNSNNVQMPTNSHKFDKRKKNKRSRKVKKQVKPPTFEQPPPGFSAVSSCIASKCAKNNRPNMLQELLEVDNDILIRIKMYKNLIWPENSNPDVILEGLSYSEMEFTGRHYVSDIMEHFICERQTQNQKGVLNGFFFIKDVFYVDKNQRSTVNADSIRSCVEAHDLGTFSKRDMRTCRLDELDFKLGETDLFIHGTSCEHTMVFSQVRLLEPQDPNRSSDYPRKLSTVEFNKEADVSCFKCRAFNPQWIVSACARVQFHIGLYCDVCYKAILFDNNDKPLCKFQSLPYPEIEVTNN